MSDPLSRARLSDKYFAQRLTLSASAVDYDLNSNFSLFKSSGNSSNFSETRGHRDGLRCNIRIKPETNPIWVKYNDTDNDPIYIAGNEVYEEFNINATNIYLTPADATTAQVDRIVFANDVSGSYNNTYVKLYARDANGVETVYGLWFNINSAGVQPVNSEVDTWLVVAAATNATGATIAAAAELVIDAVTNIFTSEDSTPGTLNITHSVSGSRTNAVDVGTPATVTTQTEGAGQSTVVHVLVR